MQDDSLDDSPEELFTRTERSRFLARLDKIQFLICLGFVALLILLFDTGRFDRLEKYFFDAFLRSQPAQSIHSSLLFIDINEESLNAIGVWPWPVDYLIQMIDFLTAAGAKAIVLTHPLKVDSPEEEAQAEAALTRSGRVFLPVQLAEKGEKKIWVHSLPVVIEKASGKKVWAHAPKTVEAAARGVGHVELETDSDGVLRQVQWEIEAEGESYPALSLAVVSDADPEFQTRSLRVDKHAKSYLSWPRHWRAVERIAAADLVRAFQFHQNGAPSDFDWTRIRDKVCFIGFSAGDQAQTYVTPVEKNVPLAVIQLQMANHLLLHRAIVPIGKKSSVLGLLLLGLGAAMLFSSIRTVKALLSGLLLQVLWLFVAYVLFITQGIWISVFHPLLLISLLFTFSAIYQQIRAAKERRHLLNLATRDGLTGLYVIRHFREILNQVVRAAVKNKESIAVILIDIDDFKKINDTYGHPAGDMVLKKTAQIVFSCLRSKRTLHEMDFVARYGGEEIILLLRKTALQEAAQKVGERIRSEIERADFSWQHARISVTASLGVASLGEGETVPDPMVRRADEALYQAKRSGKNRVCVQVS